MSMKMWNVYCDDIWSSHEYWQAPSFYLFYDDGTEADDIPFFFKLLDLI